MAAAMAIPGGLVKAHSNLVTTAPSSSNSSDQHGTAAEGSVGDTVNSSNGHHQGQEPGQGQPLPTRPTSVVDVIPPATLSTNKLLQQRQQPLPLPPPTYSPSSRKGGYGSSLSGREPPTATIITTTANNNTRPTSLKGRYSSNPFPNF